MATPAGITFYGEQWTAEVARLLLEVDAGWVGFRGDAAWSWCDETYAVFSAVCDERQWPCNSQAACVAMLQALRTGAISMQLSRTTRSSDGFAQWSLAEMRELGALMKRVVDGKIYTLRWAAQLAAFVDHLKAKDASYDLKGRTTEDFAARAAKYVPEPILRLLDLQETTIVKTRRTRRGPTPERRVTRGRAEETASEQDSNDEPLMPRRFTRANTTKKRGRRTRSDESDGDNAYHDPTSDEEEVEYWEDDSALRRFGPEEEDMPVTQELTSPGELLAVAEEQRKPNSVGQSRPSLPENIADEEKRRGSMSASRPSSAASKKRVSPHQDAPAKQRTRLRQGAPVSPRPDEADQANGSQNDAKPTRQPSRKHQRVQQPTVNGHCTSNEAPHVFRSLNPYDRPGKPWGEFILEVLLAERTARNEDELDYVQFVRGLYEI